jgi:uncharacterized membrane protein
MNFRIGYVFDVYMFTNHIFLVLTRFGIDSCHRSKQILKVINEISGFITIIICYYHLTKTDFAFQEFVLEKKETNIQ